MFCLLGKPWGSSGSSSNPRDKPLNPRQVLLSQTGARTARSAHRPKNLREPNQVRLAPKPAFATQRLDPPLDFQRCPSLPLRPQQVKPGQGVLCGTRVLRGPVRMGSAQAPEATQPARTCQQVTSARARSLSPARCGDVTSGSVWPDAE